MGLTSIPEDILLEVAAYLSVTDVLSLKQTCRVLHAFGSTDYLWHSLIPGLDLPLDIPPGVPYTALSSDELQKIVIKAIRLEANWQRRTPRVKRTRALVHNTREAYVDEMHLVPGGKWLLTAQRYRQRDGRQSCHINLWSLSNINDAYRVASIEITGAYRSSALELQEDAGLATLVVGMNDERDVIEVHSVSLQDRVDFSCYMCPSRTASRRITVPSHPRGAHILPVIHQLAVADGVIAATVVAHGGESPLQILLANARAGRARWVHPRLLELFSFLWVRLRDGHLLLLGTIRSSLVLRIYRLPPSVRAGAARIYDAQDELEDCELVELGMVVAEYEDPIEQDSVELHDIARVSPASMSFLTVLIFYSFTDALSGVAQLTRFPLSLSPRTATKAGATRYFFMPPDASAQLAQVGATGRAVWLEHNWETQLKRIMRYQPRGVGKEIGVLLPPDPELPFTPNTCHSLAFDEITGRLCLGMYDGELYVLDFV
ncbi:hypothetical protein AcV7_006393 [Taiwanofungus camphoratus]|nr:hypothetical protein AcV7_006393 [Antrodia cinnamomea]